MSSTNYFKTLHEEEEITQPDSITGRRVPQIPASFSSTQRTTSQPGGLHRSAMQNTLSSLDDSRYAQDFARDMLLTPPANTSTLKALPVSEPVVPTLTALPISEPVVIRKSSRAPSTQHSRAVSPHSRAVSPSTLRALQDEMSQARNKIEMLQRELEKKATITAAPTQSHTNEVRFNFRFTHEMLTNEMLNDNSGRQLNSWLISFENTAITASGMRIYSLAEAPTEQQSIVVQAAVSHLRGRALEWWTWQERERTQKGIGRVQTWKGFVDMVKEQFFPRSAQQATILALMSMKQMPNERTATFLARFSATCMTLNSWDDQLYVWHMIDGLSSLRLQEETRRTLLQFPADYGTIPKVQTLVLQLELAYNLSAAASATQTTAASSNTATRGKPSQPFTTPKPITAANVEASVGETAHLAILSAEEQKLMTEGRCFRCKEKGHRRRDCPLSPMKKQA